MRMRQSFAAVGNNSPCQITAFKERLLTNARYTVRNNNTIQVLNIRKGIFTNMCYTSVCRDYTVTAPKKRSLTCGIGSAFPYGTMPETEIMNPLLRKQ
jgi:hypothetical protein